MSDFSTASQALRETPPYAGYAYAYPHKTAYRPLPSPIPLAEVWQDEPKDSLFLYIHVPFCEHRCGYCNLFTQAHPEPAAIQPYLDALERQARCVKDALSGAQFARFAVGGGTPTLLGPSELERLFDIAAAFGAKLGSIPTAIELSPDTTTDDKVALLGERGVTRVSLGVETLNEDEARALSRPQKRAVVEAALERLRRGRFASLNVDLIYGIPGQTPQSLQDSLQGVLRFEPEEIFLYPLYVRPLTGLGLSKRARASSPDQERLTLYASARDFLRERGYTQSSMRAFHRKAADVVGAPTYCCQADGMVGLGAGARSYTRSLHYSSEWAVGRSGVGAIIDDFVARDDGAHRVANYGFSLDREEQKRRWVIQSLLQAEGLDQDAYNLRFESEALDDLPELHALLELNWARVVGRHLVLEQEGLARSDAIGPWLYSTSVRRKMGEYTLR